MGHPFLDFGLSVVCQINPFFATSLLSPLNPYQESGWGSIFSIDNHIPIAYTHHILVALHSTFLLPTQGSRPAFSSGSIEKCA